jgi:uncharacterized protein YabN with tetrapyrrole methylase and pyrophosphatase domain
LEKKITQDLLAETKKKIADIRREKPGLRRVPFTQEIWDNIKVLSENFSNRELIQSLSISPSTMYKAKKLGRKTPKKPFKFLEVHTANVDIVPSPFREVRVIMEFKTKSGMTISIFE